MQILRKTSRDVSGIRSPNEVMEENFKDILGADNARPFEPHQKSISRILSIFGKTWLQERGNGAHNEAGTTLEGPFVDRDHRRPETSSITGLPRSSETATPPRALSTVLL